MLLSVNANCRNSAHNASSVRRLMWKCVCDGGGLFAFFVRNRANVVGDPLERVDEDVQVRAVDFAPHEEVQVCGAVLGLPPWTTLDVEEFCLKGLCNDHFKCLSPIAWEFFCLCFSGKETHKSSLFTHLEGLNRLHSVFSYTKVG